MTYTHCTVSQTAMSDKADRLRKAIQDSNLSMREICDRYGWNYNTFKSNANGSMSFSFEKAMVYAGRLKVRAEWLYSGAGAMRQESKSNRPEASEVPILGWVQAGQMGDITAMHDLAEVEIAITEHLGPGEWFATTVVGDSMDRVSPEGSRIFVNATERDPVSGGFYLFSHRGETTYKRFYDEPVKRLEPYSTNPSNKTIFLTRTEAWTIVGRVHRTVFNLT